MPGISSLLDSDMEDNVGHIDENSLISSEDSMMIAGKKDATKKPKKRKCVTMPKKQKTGRTAAANEPNPTTKKSAQIAGSKRKGAPESGETKEALGENSDLEETQPPQRGRPRATAKPKASKKAAVPQDDQFEEGDIVARSNFAQTKTSTNAPKPTAKPKPKPAKIAQPEEPVANLEELEPEEESQPTRKKPRTQSLVRQEPSYRRRAGSASDTERGDPMLRRKLGDITRKYENMDVKYRNLKQVGIAEASANMEKLRRQCEATTEASNKLVASLRKELALHSSASQTAKKLEKELHSRDTDKDKLAKTNAELSASLAAANNEIKALQAKLAAARSSSAAPESKPNGNGANPKQIARPQHASETESQLKLDLYSDLTGLIIRSAKQAPDGDTYDCIQTGRNGTLHFKLFVDLEEAKSVSFEETEFLYTPLLDANRDRDMIEIMPPYLVEDITFARGNAAKFYARVVDTLTQKPVVLEDDGIDGAEGNS